MVDEGASRVEPGPAQICGYSKAGERIMGKDLRSEHDDDVD